MSQGRNKKVAEELGRTRYNRSKVNKKFIEKVQECKITDEELMYLSTLKIIPFHEVPPQHKVERQAGSRITKEERAKFNAICKLHNGPFTTAEDETITKNWRAFCETHKWNHLKPQPFLNMKFGGKSIMKWKYDRLKFVQILARDLLDRSLYSVYHRFRNLHSNHKVDRYTDEEDQIILNHIKNCNEEDDKTKYATLAKILHRTRMSVWRRAKLLQKSNTIGRRKFEKRISSDEEESEDDTSHSDSSESDDENDVKNTKIIKKVKTSSTIECSNETDEDNIDVVKDEWK